MQSEPTSFLPQNQNFLKINLFKIIHKEDYKLQYMYLMLTYLLLINSCLNPVALFCTSLAFRRQVKRYLTCCCKASSTLTKLQLTIHLDCNHCHYFHQSQVSYIFQTKFQHALYTFYVLSGTHHYLTSSVCTKYTGMRRVMTFQLMDRIYEGGAIRICYYII
jgi:hypothetical protein